MKRQDGLLPSGTEQIDFFLVFFLCISVGPLGVMRYTPIFSPGVVGGGSVIIYYVFFQAAVFGGDHDLVPGVWCVR